MELIGNVKGPGQRHIAMVLVSKLTSGQEASITASAHEVRASKL